MSWRWFVGRLWPAVDRERSARIEAEALAQLARTVNASLDADIVLQRITEAARDLARGDWAHISLYDATADALFVRYEIDAKGPRTMGLRLERGRGIEGLVLTSGRPFRTDDYTADPRIPDPYVAEAAAERVVSELAVPILVDGEVVGVVCVDNRARRPFTDHDERLLSRVADHAAIALRNARLYGEAEGRRREAEKLATVARALTENLDLARVGALVTESILRLVRVESAALRLLQADGSTVAVALAGPAAEHFSPGDVLPPGAGVVGRAALEGRMRWSIDALTDPDVVLTDRLRERMRRSGASAVLAVPLSVRGHTIGALSLADRTGRVFDDDEIALAQAFADQVALAVERVRLDSQERAARAEAEALASVAAAVSASLDLPRVLQEVAEAVRRVTGSDLVRIALPEGDHGALVYRYLSGTRASGYETLRLRAGRGFVGRVMETRQPYRIVEAASDPAVEPTYGRAFIEAEGVRSAMVVPILDDDRLQGAIYAARRVPVPFTDDDEVVCSRLAAHAAIALRNAALYREATEGRAAAEEAAHRAELLSEASERLTLTREYDVAIAGVLRAMLPTLGEWGEAFLSTRAGGFRRIGPVGSNAAAEALAGEIAAQQCPVQWRPDDPVERQLLAGHTIVQNALTDDWFECHLDAPAYVGALRTLAPRALLLAPLVVRGRSIGALVFMTTRADRGYAAPDVALATDVARRTALAVDNVRLYRRAETARVEAERANQAKDEFLAMLGHELRNPLNAIAGAVGILGRPTIGTDTATRALDVISRQVRHLTGLMDDLLDVARVTTGKIGLQRCALDLAAVARRTLDGLRDAGRLARHAVGLEAQTVWAVADETRIEQVLSNLVTNAVKFTPPGESIRVTVDPDGPNAVVSVEDTGIGIDADMLPRIFDLFVQGQRTLDRSQGGLGLGLTLARRLVELHGGTIEAVSEGRGRGSRFTVRLPRIAPPAAASRPSAALAPERGGPAPRRILVVEDNEDARDMLRLALTLAGHEVRDAADGPSAITIAASQIPDVALIDIGLPGLDGYEVARLLRGLAGGKSVMLVALTGYGQAEDRVRALSAGFDIHLTKPVAPHRVVGLIAGALETRPPSR